MTAFILGAPRSGTTLVYKALCLHPDAAWISNWVRRAPRLPALAVLNRVSGYAPDARRRAWFGDGSNAYTYGRPRPLVQRLFPAPVEGEPVFEACGFDDGPDGGRGDLERLARTAAAICAASGGRVFVNKRIANNRRVRALAAAFPDSRFVLVVRDPRAVACSLRKVDWWPTHRVWWYGGTPGDWEAAGHDPWELCARVWREDLAAATAGLATIPAERVLTVRYEDFLAAPVDLLREIGQFVGLPDDPRWSSALSALSFPDRRERWRTELPAPAAATIVTAAGAELDQWDYAPEPAGLSVVP